MAGRRCGAHEAAARGRQQEGGRRCAGRRADRQAATTEPARGPRRLLSDIEAGDYIGASRSYVRALVANGVLRRIELPATNGTSGRARMLRLDVRDLDAWIDQRKT
jgi:hypothetical protein